MTLYDLFQNWGDISYSKKISALKKVLAVIEKEYNKDDELIYDMLFPAFSLEGDDYFGTEGLQID